MSDLHAAERIKAEAMSIFADPPQETSQDVRDVIEWYHAQLRIELARAALSAPAAPQREWCCEAGWARARDKAWAARDTNCGCDHIAYCRKCFPVEFRDGGKWRKYSEPDAAPSPQEQTNG